jgi:hypothetical protein
MFSPYIGHVSPVFPRGGKYNPHIRVVRVFYCGPAQMYRFFSASNNSMDEFATVPSWTIGVSPFGKILQHEPERV